MDIQNLRAFVAIATLGSFSGAAKSLFLTQPAITKRLHALEERLDCRLLDRAGRQVHLTAAGEMLLPQARRILAEVENTTRMMHNLHQQVSGPLSFATSHHIGLHRLPGLLRDFTALHPEVALDIHFQESELAYDAVLDRDVEFAFVTLTGDTDNRIMTTPLWREPLVFVAGRDHPLAQRASLTLADLTDTPAILPHPRSYTYQLIREAFDREELPLTTALPVNYLETIKMMVSVGLGWSALPTGMLDHQLVALPLPGEPVERHLGVIRLRHRTLSNAAAAFLDRLSASMDQG